MAKQSWKQQMYEQIANSQVQQVLQQQRADQLQNDFANWQKQQNDIAQLQASFAEWKNSQPTPEPVQPVQTAPVQTVKKAKEEAKTIPSLEDYFRPKTLSGRDINKETANYLQRENYQREQQKENALASTKPKDNRTANQIVQDAIRGNNENVQTDNIRNMFGNTVSEGQNSIKNMLQAEVPSTTNTVTPDPEAERQAIEVQNAIESVSEDAINQYAQKRGISVDAAKAEVEGNIRNAIAAKYASIESPGMTNDVTQKMTQQAQANSAEQKRLAAQRQYTPYEAWGLATGKAVSDVVNGPVYLAGKVLGTNWDLYSDRDRERYAQSKEQHPTASNLGTMSGMALAGYAAGGGAGGRALASEGLPTAAEAFNATQGEALLNGAGKTEALLRGLGVAGRQTLANAGRDILRTDLATDIIPTLANDIAEGKSTREVVGNTVFNTLLNGAFNSVGDIASLAKPVRNSLGGTATKEVLNGVADSVDNVPSGATRQMIPGMETESAVTDEINNQFSQLMGMYQPETSAMRNIYSADDLSNSLNEQLANAIRANQADEAIESATKAMPEAPVNEVANAVNDVSPIRTEIDDMSEVVTNRIYDVGYKVDAANNEALSKSYNELLGYEEKWAKAISNSSDIDEIRQATKDLNNAISRFNTRAKKVDPSISKDIYNKKFSSMLDSFNGRLDDYYNGAKRADEAAEAILGSEAAKPFDETPSKVMAEDIGLTKTAEPESAKVTYQIPDTPENAPTEVRPSVPDEAPNMKVSEAYTNTGKRGGGWNEAEYNKYTNPDDYLYESIDEVRSVEEATNMRATEGREAFKNRVLGADRVSSVELDGLMMEWRELTEEARALEAAGKDASDLWAESNKIFRKVQTQSSNNAQALQSLAKWSRNTPEGMLINAENIVNGKNKVPQSDLQKFIEKHFKQKKGDIEFSPEFEKEFLNTAESLRGLSGEQLDTREAKEAMAKLGKMVNEQLPVRLNEKLQSFLMDNMLGNFRTLITRNAGGNLGLNAVEQVAQRPLAAGIDSLVSLKTGKRTQAGLSRAGLAEYISGFGKGLADEAKDFKTGLHTARSGENTLENAIRANRHVFQTKVADGLDGLVKSGLSVGDRPYYEGVYKQTLGDYYRLRARGLMGDQVQSLSDADFKIYAETAAKMNALGAVYQQDTMLSNALMGFKKDVGMLSNGILGVDILSQFSMPFVKTPANVIERAIDYSPLGLIRNAFRTGRELKGGVFDQNRFANETARNILGTAMMGGGAAYAANGGLSGGYSDNANEKQAQKEAGMQEYAWNVPEAIPALGGKQMDISWLPVVGSNMVASAAAVDEFNKGEGNFGENLTKGVQAGGEALFDQSMFQGLQRLFGTGETYNSDEGIVGNMKNVVTSGVGQAIPSLLRQVAQVGDEYQRDTSYSNKGTSFGPFNTYAINSLANNIPGLRENYLAPKVDTSGNLLKENQGRNLGMKVLEDMILPGKITDVNMSPLAQEASRLSGATENAFIPKAKRTAIDSEEHTLTNDEWVEYQQNYYKQMTNAGNQIVDGDIYKNADEDAQAKMLHDAYGAIKSAIDSEYTGKEVTGAAKAYKEAGGGDKGVQAVVNYFNAKQLTDEAGLSSSSKAAKEIQEAVASGNTAEANQKASDAATILDSGINAHGYDVYKANKNSIKDTDSWISEYNKIDGLGNSDGFVSQEEFLKAIKKNNWSESEAVKYAKIYGTWEKIPYLKKDGTWGFHKVK